MSPPDPTDLIFVAKAAALLDVGVGCLYRWALAGRLRMWKLGGRNKVSRAELLALLVEQRVADRPAARPRTSAASLAVLRKAGFRV